MPRRFGAKAVGLAKRRIAKAKGIPVGKVTLRMVAGRLNTRIPPLGHASPGEKVRPFGGSEPAEQMLRRLRRLAEAPGYRVNKGMTKRGGHRR